MNTTTTYFKILKASPDQNYFSDQAEISRTRSDTEKFVFF
jgi:hypothetical protein